MAEREIQQAQLYEVASGCNDCEGDCDDCAEKKYFEKELRRLDSSQLESNEDAVVDLMVDESNGFELAVEDDPQIIEDNAKEEPIHQTKPLLVDENGTPISKEGAPVEEKKPEPGSAKEDPDKMDKDKLIKWALIAIALIIVLIIVAKIFKSK